MKPKPTKQNLFDIDMHRLPEECALQPRLRLEAGEKLADARLEYEAAKAAETVAVATVDKDVRADPRKYGLTNPPREHAIKNVIALDLAVGAARKRTRQARHDMDILVAQVRAIENKKGALKDLVQMHLGGFRADVKVNSFRKGDALEEWKQERRRARSKLEPDDPDDEEEDENGDDD